MTELENRICKIVGGKTCVMGDVIQQLWSGYGVIRKAKVDELNFVIKHIDTSQSRKNPRGWTGDVAHRRKVHSYDVEINFYRQFASRCNKLCRLPRFLGAERNENSSESLLVIEDLDAAGFSKRKTELAMNDIKACLRWLANFHATFAESKPKGLWPVGSYWHLATRPDELNTMADGPLKSLARRIDDVLQSAEYQTVIHGDAKTANFCFSDSQSHGEVAAVDFQYTGLGVGIKDVAYFVSSCLNDRQAARDEEFILDYYFEVLAKSLAKDFAPDKIVSIEMEWRSLYPYAWADFCRFLLGWSPTHWKLNNYAQTMTEKVIAELSG